MGMHRLFTGSPARSRDYTEVTGCTRCKHFCSTRWVENVTVTLRAIAVWENVKKYVKSGIVIGPNKSSSPGSIPHVSGGSTKSCFTDITCTVQVLRAK